jgi:hypothetical protein
VLAVLRQAAFAHDLGTEAVNVTASDIRKRVRVEHSGKESVLKSQASRALERQEDNGACRPQGAARLAKVKLPFVVFICGFKAAL